MLRIIALTCVFASPALGQEKTFAFSGVDSIDARNGVTVNVVPGDEIAVIATARSGDVEQLEIRKFGPWLALNRNTRWFIFPFGRQDDIVVTITLPELRNIKAFETATATADGFAGDALRIEAIEGGTVSVTNSDVTDLTLVATQGGSLKVTGTCETVVAEATFGADIEAADLVCVNAAAATRGNGAITVQASGFASTDMTEGGTIDLVGGAQVVQYLPGMEPEPEEAEPEG